MLVVSNTSPILNLAIVNQLGLLPEQFGEILIPNAVLYELKISEDRPGSQAIREAVSAGWIQIREVSNEPLAKLLQQTLDRGESEAITAKQSGKLDSLQPVVDGLIKQAGFRIAPELLGQILKD